MASAYARDLASWGLPGMTFMTRYIKGSDAELRTTDSGRERERGKGDANAAEPGPHWRSPKFGTKQE